MNIVWDYEALAELEDASDFYEENAYGLGDDFLKEAQKALGAVLLSPSSPRVIEHDCRKVRLKRFPYTIVYLVRESEIIVVSVMHQKREPSHWHHRVK